MKWLRCVGDGLCGVMLEMGIGGLDIDCDICKEQEEKGDVEEEMDFASLW